MKAINTNEDSAFTDAELKALVGDKLSHMIDYLETIASCRETSSKEEALIAALAVTAKNADLVIDAIECHFGERPEGGSLPPPYESLHQSLSAVTRVTTPQSRSIHEAANLLRSASQELSAPPTREKQFTSFPTFALIWGSVAR